MCIKCDIFCIISDIFLTYFGHILFRNLSLAFDIELGLQLGFVNEHLWGENKVSSHSVHPAWNHKRLLSGISHSCAVWDYAHVTTVFKKSPMS